MFFGGGVGGGSLGSGEIERAGEGGGESAWWELGAGSWEREREDQRGDRTFEKHHDHDDQPLDSISMFWQLAAPQASRNTKQKEHHLAVAHFPSRFFAPLLLLVAADDPRRFDTSSRIATCARSWP